MNLGESVWEIGTVIPRLTAQLVTLMQPCGTIFCSYKSTPKIFFIMLLCSYRSYIMSTPVPAHEGRRPEAVLKVEQDVASRGCARNAGSGGSETARRALRPVLRGARCTCFGGNAEAGNADPRPKIATVWSAERRGVPIARDVGAPRKRPGLPRKQANRCLASTGRLSALPHPSPGGLCPPKPWRRRVEAGVGIEPT